MYWYSSVNKIQKANGNDELYHFSTLAVATCFLYRGPWAWINFSILILMILPTLPALIWPERLNSVSFLQE